MNNTTILKTANNGLTGYNGNVKIGGSLTGDTDVSLGSHQFSLTKNSTQLKFTKINGFLRETGFNGQVYSTTLQPDGKIIVGGQFTVYNNSTVNNIVRLNSDGTVDSSFLTVTLDNGSQLIVTLQPDGKILIGGGFTKINGNSYNKIARLNSNGSIDPSFTIGSGFNNGVFAIKLQTDNKILIGGQFTTYNGSSSSRVIRLNTDGSVDNSFIVGTGFNNDVQAITIQSDGKILLGGFFITYKGVSVTKGIARLNTTGGTDASFVTGGTGFNNAPNTIIQQPDGNLLVAGFFTTYNGVSNNRIIRLNSTGGTDSSFVVGTGFNQVVNAMILTGSSIYVGGQFATYKGVTVNGIVRLNSTGGTDNTFSTGIAFLSGQISTLALQTNNKLIVGGSFGIYNTTGTNNFIRLNNDGSVDTSLSNVGGFNSSVASGVVQNDGKLVLIGGFTSFNGTSANGITRLTTSGTTDTSFVYGTGFVGTPQAIAIQTDGKTIVGGNFTSYNGTSINRIIRLNTTGGTDSSFVVGSGFNNSATALAIQPDGKIIVIGSFTTYSGVTANRIIRLNTNGSVDTSFVYGSGFSAALGTGLLLQSDGKILVGSYGTYNGGSLIHGLIRLNSTGGTDSTFNIGTGFNGSTNSGIRVIKQQLDGKFVIGGTFSMFNNKPSNRIIRLNIDGSVDTSFNVGLGFPNSTGFDFIQTIYLNSDGTMILGGQFNQYKNAAKGTSNNIIKLNSTGSTDASFTIGSGFQSSPNIILSSNNLYYVGGGFNSYNGNITHNIASLNQDGTINNNTTDNLQIVNAPILYAADYSSQFNGNSLGTKDYIIKNIGFIGNGITKTSNNFTGLGGSITQNTNINDDNLLYTLSLKSKTTSLFSGQHSLSLNSSFFVGNGFDSDVNTIALQPDGKILVGGGFTNYNGNAASYVTRLTKSGTTDTSFLNMGGFGTQIFAIQSDGKIVISGGFSEYNATTTNFIIRVNSTGGTDSTYTVGTGFNVGGQPTTFALQPDNKLFVGGFFTSYNGTGANRIIRLTTSGTTDTSFVYGTGFNSQVTAIALQSDGKILVGGNFTTYKGGGSTRIIRIDASGNTDSSFVVGSGFNGSINNNGIVIQPDGKAIVSGGFTTYKGVTANRLIRLNTTGGTDSTFNVGAGLSSGANAIALQSDGKIILGGSFTTYSGVTVNRIVRLNTNGTIDTTFKTGVGFNVNAVTSVVIQSDGKILVGGQFTSYNGTAINRFIRLNSNGTIDAGNTTISGGLLGYDNDYSFGFGKFSIVDKNYVTGLTNSISVPITGVTNGLSVVDKKIKLGGSLTGTTSLLGGSNDLNFGFTTGKFKITGTTYNFSWDTTNKRFFAADSSQVTGGTYNYTFGVDNRNGGSFGSVTFGESSEITINGGDSMVCGEGSFVDAYGGKSFARGGAIRVGGDYGFIGGGWDPGFANGKTNNKVPQVSGFGSFGWYTTDTNQIANQGLRAAHSAILAGLNHDIPSNSVRSVILGGNAIKATSATTDTVFMPKVRIGQGVGGSITTGSTSNSYLTINTSTGEIETRKFSVNIRSLTGNTTINVTDQLILVDTSSLAIIVTLPTPSSVENGQTFNIKDKSGNASTHNITVNGNGVNIDAGSSSIINTNYGAITVTYSSADSKYYVTGFVN